MVFQEQPPYIMFVLLVVSPASVSLSLPLCPKRASTGDTAWKLETGNQHPRRFCQKPLESDRGVATHDPDLAAKCMLYCFLSGMVALRAAGNMLAPPPSLSKNNTKCSRGSRA